MIIDHLEIMLGFWAHKVAEVCSEAGSAMYGIRPIDYQDLDGIAVIDQRQRQ